MVSSVAAPPPALNCTKDNDWVALAVEALDTVGYAVVEGALAPDQIDLTKSALREAERRIEAQVGRAGVDYTELRLVLKEHPQFLRLLEHSPMLRAVDALLSPTAVLRFQNGVIARGYPLGDGQHIPEYDFHINFPRARSEERQSVDIALILDAWGEDNGGLFIVPGSNGRPERPTGRYLEWAARLVACPAGSMLIMDSSVWHKGAMNRSSRDRMAVVHQFTRSYFKPHFDYPRALGCETMAALSPRIQTLLGWRTRVPTSLAEFYQPDDARLYHSGQDY